jgi:hypothetical protein
MAILPPKRVPRKSDNVNLGSKYPVDWGYLGDGYLGGG